MSPKAPGTSPQSLPTAPFSWEDRLHISYLIHASDPIALQLNSGQDVVAGFSRTPKSLPPHYFYDDRGSQLFEQICELPEYYLTRTETAILQQYASEIAALTGPCELVELGSGSATKTRILLDAYEAQDYPLHYLPIDISGGILESSARDLLADYPTLKVEGLVGTYELALSQLALPHLPTRMICFLGSTLGNLNPAECDQFFQNITASLQPGEFFLLGVDLQKPISLLEAAYDDSQGITAQFNLNMLQHLNWRFQGNFDLSQFEHLAFYNSDRHQIEIYVRSLAQQVVELQKLNLTLSLEQDELILTEISRKFDLTQLQQELHNQGLHPIHVWTDAQAWFGMILCQTQPKLTP